MDDKQDLSALSYPELDARLEQVSSARNAIQAQFTALIMELLARRVTDLVPSARYLDLQTNPNYENGTFWEFSDILDASGQSIFGDPDTAQDDPTWQAVEDLFNDDFSSDYTDCLGVYAGSYFDLVTHDAIEDVPALTAGPGPGHSNSASSL